MTTLEILFTTYLVICTGLCIALLYTLKRAIDVMKMASTNSGVFYRELIKTRNQVPAPASVVTNVSNISEAVEEAVKMARAEAAQQAKETAAEAMKQARAEVLQQAREAAAGDTADVMNRRELK